MRNFEHLLFLPEQCCHHRVLRMSVYTGASVTDRKSIPEKRGACRLFQVQLGATKENPVGMWRRLCLGIRQDEYMRRLDALLLYARGSDVHLIATGNRSVRVRYSRQETNSVRIQMPPPVPVTHPNL